MPHQRERVLDDVMDVLTRALQWSRTSIIQKDVDDVAGAMDGFFHVLNQLGFVLVFGLAVQEIVRPQTQRHERVLDLVRDAGGQPADGFHLRRFDELELSPLQFCMRGSDIAQGVTEFFLGLTALGVLGLERLGAAGHGLLQTFVRFAQRREQGNHHQKRTG